MVSYNISKLKSKITLNYRSSLVLCYNFIVFIYDRKTELIKETNLNSIDILKHKWWLGGTTLGSMVVLDFNNCKKN